MRSKLVKNIRSSLVPVICLITAGYLSQCGRKNPIVPDLQYKGELELFGEGSISTSLYERDIAISPEGDEIIYTLGNHKQSIRALIGIKKGEMGWGSKEILPFSGRYYDIEPFFSPNGNYLYFASNRPMERDSSRTDYNIWRVERIPPGWGIPEPLDTLINTPGEEYYPSISGNGNLYFTATRQDGIGREDIFVSVLKNDKYLKPVVLDSAINSAVFEFNAFIHPEENLIIFSSYGRQDGHGGGDLYYSKKDQNGNWQKAINMGPGINSNSLDYCPFIDVYREVFYFTSDRSSPTDFPLNNVEELEAEAGKTLNGMGNIYRIGLDEIELN
ncbi:MAG: exo-alpha-sialidase [Flavobacteriaceae bacterium]